MKSLLCQIVSLGFLILGIHAGAQQQDMCKNFRLEAEIPKNGLHAETVIPVRVKMTNIGDKDFWMDSWTGDWRHLLLVARDAQGHAVPYSEDYQKLLGEAKHAVITLNVSTPIAAGSSIEYSFLLDKLFNLEPDRDYSFSVSRWCGTPDQQLQAETTKFSTSRPQPASTSSTVSIHLSTPETEYPVGWAVPVNISVQNHGDRAVQWATTEIGSNIPDEFVMGVEINDESGKALATVPDAKAPWTTQHYPRAGIGFVQVPATGLAEKNVALGNLYDLSHPGVYSARIVLIDATTNRRVESNEIQFTLRPADYFVGLENKKLIPPFMMSISHVPYQRDDRSMDPSSTGILMCNISDHEIWMYNASGSYAEVIGPDSKAAPMSEAELRLWNQYNDPKIAAVSKPPHGSNNWFKIAPHRGIQFGVWQFERSYDLSRPGHYRLRIYRYDEPDALEGTKLVTLPKVYSNWMNFEVRAKSGIH